MNYVIKRDGSKQEFSFEKIKNAVNKAFLAVENAEAPEDLIDYLQTVSNTFVTDKTVEEIQDFVENTLMEFKWYDVVREYIKYRERHNESRFIRERLDYMENYSSSNGNAASSSETDANSNVAIKNVANLEGEVYKLINRNVQRARMKDKLYELYPDVAKQYIKDLEDHIIYAHDEASTPVLKYYCCAVTLYPLLMDGVGNMDGVTPSAPNDIASFSGQITNLIFLLSSQCKGAVAVGDYFVALNYYVVKEFGKNWYDRLDEVITNGSDYTHTVKYFIRKGMKQFIYGVNQPAGNRSFNSPFSNISYYDSIYFDSLFGDFYYPDGTRPEWHAIDILQRMFMELHRELRLIKPLTFPVSTMALVHDNEKYLDEDYKQLCADEWAKGGSFFCFNSDNPTSLASCCRVLNEITENTFSSTTGMTGVMTGSCNVITLNLNRIVQNWYWETFKNPVTILDSQKTFYLEFPKYLINILDRVYKYQIAYKTMLYDLEDKGMFTASNAGYIYMKKLYSTIGIIGYSEAAKFMNFVIGNNDDYKKFLQTILGTIKEQNKIHSIHDTKRPFLFNSEAIPGENLAVKLYQWDKNDGYIVPEDQNLYNCYFYNPWDSTSVLDKLKLHGKEISKFTDGGQAAHINLDAHLSKEQYLKILDIAMTNGSNYFTFNIPMSECANCGHTVNAPITECPICHSKHIKYWTRIIGYLTCIDNWSKERQIEQKTRVYTKEQNVEVSSNVRG